MPAEATIASNPTLFQERYEAGVESALSTFTTVWGTAKESTSPFTGKRINFSVLRRRPQAFSQSVSAMTIPDASSSLNAEGSAYPTVAFITLVLDWTAQDLSQGDGAYIDLVSNNLGPATEGFVQAMERQSLGAGTGQLGTVFGGAGATAIPAAGFALVFDVAGVDSQVFFEEGQRIEFMSSLTATTKKSGPSPTRPYYEVASVNVVSASDKIIVTCTSDSVVPSATPPAHNDVIVASGAVNLQDGPGPTNTTNELYGLDILIDDGNATFQTKTPHAYPTTPGFLGIDSANSWWQAKTVPGNGRYLDLDLCHNVLDQIHNHGGGGGVADVNKVVTNAFQLRKHLLSLYPGERYANEGAAGKFQSGSAWLNDHRYGPKIGMMDSLKARFCPRSKAFFYGSQIEKHTTKKMHFYNRDGSIVRMAAGRPADMYNMYGMYQLLIKRRNGTGKVENLLTA